MKVQVAFGRVFSLLCIIVICGVCACEVSSSSDVWSKDTDMKSNTVDTKTGAKDANPYLDYKQHDIEQGMSCKQLYKDCYPKCPTDPVTGYVLDEKCLTDCQAELTASGYEAFTALDGCLAQHCANVTNDAAFSDCLFDYCFDPYIGCFHGNLSCQDILNCMSVCDEADASCPSECVYAGRYEAIKAYYAIFDCIEEHCCPKDTSKCSPVEPSYEPCFNKVMNPDAPENPGGGQCVPIYEACWYGVPVQGIMYGPVLLLELLDPSVIFPGPGPLPW